MKLLKISITTVLFSFLLMGLTTKAHAQTERAATKAYNKALKVAKQGNYEQAVNLLNQAMSQAKELGKKKGKDILQRTKKRLPQMHYQMALQKYKAFQSDQTIANIDAAINAFRTTKEVSNRYDDSKSAQKANGIITQLMYQKALVQYQQDNLKDALATLNKVIERNANYAKAYYQKGVVLKNMDSKNLEKALAQFDKAIKVAQKAGESKVVTQAKNAAREELVYRGSEATSNKNFERAINLLKRAIEYDSDSPNAYYRLAEAYNNTQQWQQAMDSAQQGLEYFTGGKTDRAKFYFELGKAYKGTGQKEEACKAFKNAAYGNFKSSAEHQMEYQVKCESATN